MNRDTDTIRIEEWQKLRDNNYLQTIRNYIRPKGVLRDYECSDGCTMFSDCNGNGVEQISFVFTSPDFDIPEDGREQIINAARNFQRDISRIIKQRRIFWRKEAEDGNL